MALNTISEEDRKAIAEGLGKVLADTYSSTKTHNLPLERYGPHFASLHNLFEEQYTELAAAVMRSLSAFACSGSAAVHLQGLCRADQLTEEGVCLLGERAVGGG